MNQPVHYWLGIGLATGTHTIMWVEFRRYKVSYSDNIPKKEVARIMGVSESTIYRLTLNNNFPLPYKIGGRTFWSKAEILGWLKKIKEKRNKTQTIMNRTSVKKPH